MCGIGGYIGRSKRPKLSYELMTNIFDFLELRGTDAAGVWGTEVGKKGRVIYHKEPVRSSAFIKSDFWKSLKNVKTDMLITHARATSKGGGNASTNANNHPFVSTDKRIGMVHNGTIEEATYLRNKYETESDTDSECLLRIFEHGMDKDIKVIDQVPADIIQRINGIKDIWSYIHTGAMAVAIGERIDEHERALCLFRNEKRPLWIADLRHILGQVVFFSSPDIWYGAIANSPNLAKVCSETEKLIEVPPNQIWYMKIDKEDNVVIPDNLFKFQLETRHSGQQFVQGEFKSIKNSEVELKLITKLNEQHQIKAEDKMANSNFLNDQSDDPRNLEEELWNERRNDIEEVPDWNSIVKSTQHIDMCERIVRQANAISTMTDNLIIEGSMPQQDYDQLLTFLDTTISDLQATISLLR